MATAVAVVATEGHEISMWIYAIALACGAWYMFLLIVQAIGFTQLCVNQQKTMEMLLTEDYTDTVTTL